MRALVASTIIAILLAPAATNAADKYVQIIVDDSIAMWRTLDDGEYRFVAIRAALEALIAGLPNDGKTHVSMRLMGSDLTIDAPDACMDTRLAAPVQENDLPALAESVRSVAPRGARPLVLAIVRAAADLPDSRGRRRIVIVTSGDDTCHGDRREAANVLKDGVELRFVGIDLSEQIGRRFSAAAPLKNATTTEELTAALAWSVYGPDPPAKARQLRITPAGGAVIDAPVKLTNVSTSTPIEMPFRNNLWSAKVPPGFYTAQLANGAPNSPEYGHVMVAASSENSYSLDFSSQLPTTIEVISHHIVAGDEIWVQYWGAPEGDHWISIAPAGAPIGAWTDRIRSSSPAGEALLRTPTEAGELEVRLLQPRVDGLLRLAGWTAVTSQPPEVILEVPESAILGQEMSITWQGPDHPGDHLVITASDKGLLQRTTCVYTSRGSPITLQAPGAEGEYTIHYISGLSAASLGRTEISITDVPVRLDSPEQAIAGRDFAVEWDGPSREGDYLTLADPDTPDDEYLSLYPVSGGSPASFAAPRTPGVYEIRYVSDIDDTSKGSTSIEVIALRISLSAPEIVRSGTRFDIVWEGPDGPGDFISIAPVGSRRERRDDWAFTSMGSPANIAAPFEPGTYEIRYISGANLRILERSTLEVK